MSDIKFRNVEDAIMKSIMDIFKEDALKFFGIEGKIITSARTEIKHLEVTTSFMDYSFLLDDGSIIHFEFQTTNKKEDLSRFLAYDALLHYKEKRRIRTIVVYSSNIERTETNLDLGSIKYEVEPYYMGNLDGEEKYIILKNKINNNVELTKQDLLTLVFLPIMNNKSSKTERILDSLELANKIKDKENQMNSLALLYAFAEKFVDEENMKMIKEGFKMTELGKLLKQEGFEEGKAEGKAEVLIKQLLKKFKKLPDGYIEKIMSLKPEVIETIATDIFEINSVEDLKQYF